MTDTIPPPSPEDLELDLAAEYAYCLRVDDQSAAGIIRRCVAAERERDAYKKAKAENDERFMVERDDARAERDKLREILSFAVAHFCDPEAVSRDPAAARLKAMADEVIQPGG